MGFLWDFMGFLWDFMGFLWDFYGISIGFHGISMGYFVGVAGHPFTGGDGALGSTWVALS